MPAEVAPWLDQASYEVAAAICHALIPPHAVGPQNRTIQSHGSEEAAELYGALLRMADHQSNAGLLLGEWQPYRDLDWANLEWRLALPGQPDIVRRGGHSLACGRGERRLAGGAGVLVVVCAGNNAASAAGAGTAAVARRAWQRRVVVAAGGGADVATAADAPAMAGASRRCHSRPLAWQAAY